MSELGLVESCFASEGGGGRVDDRDPAYDYDGDWEGIDSGEGFAEHLLSPVDSYHRKDHYTPHPRFATRPEMRWVKAEDPIENLPARPATRVPGRGAQQRNQRRPARKPSAPRREAVSNPVLTPADAERVERAFGTSFRTQRPTSPKRCKGGDADPARQETRGERLARRKGCSKVKGLSLRQAKDLPDLRQSAWRHSRKAQATPDPDPRNDLR
jgi:hypothetical protein